MNQEVIVIPFKDFKERIQITNQYLEKGYKVEYDDKNIYAEKSKNSWFTKYSKVRKKK